MKIFVHGKPQPGFLAANHTSYLDPIVVLALKAGGAVSKVEVKSYFLGGPGAVLRGRTPFLMVGPKPWSGVLFHEILPTILEEVVFE